MERKTFAADTAHLVAQGTITSIKADRDGRFTITLSDLDRVRRTVVIAIGEPAVWLEVTQFTDLTLKAP